MESMEASMTMTSGVGTPFYMAPEIVTGSKHYNGTVDVYSFGIMAAQVMVGKLVFEVNDFATPYCLFLTYYFSNASSYFFLLMIMTAFVSAVCQGMRPIIMNCSEELKKLITLCWDSNPSSRPCLLLIGNVLLCLVSLCFFFSMFHSI